MDVFLEVTNLIFIFVGLYFAILFLFLFFGHEKKIFKKPRIKKFPSVSIIIPAYNEEKTIAKTVEAVKKMIYPRKKEIIVIDDGCKDKTYEIAKKIRGIKVLRKKRGGKASALNWGLKKAKGEIFVCIDSDSYPDKNALMNSIPLFEKNIASVTTTVIVRNTQTLIEKLQQLEYIFIAWSRKVLEYLNSIYVTPGPMSLYKRKVLLEIGGFDEKNMTEDIEIAWRLMSHKYKIKMALDAKVSTYVPSNIKKWWHQRIRWNVGGMQTFFKYYHLFLSKEIKNLGMFLIPLFSLSYGLSILGLIFLFYLTFNLSRYLIGVYSFGFSLIGPIYFIPNLFWFFGFISIIFSLIYLRTNIKTMNNVTDFPKSILHFIFYLFVYTLIFPFNLLHSSIKFLKKSYEW